MEREFSLKEMLSYILNNAKKLICIALVLMVIVATIGVILTQFQETTEYSIKEDKIKEESYKMLQFEMNELNEYIESSIYLSLNAFKKAEAIIISYIDTDYQIMPDKTYQNTDKTSAIIDSLVTIANNEADIIDGVRNLLGLDNVENRFIKELYKVEPVYGKFFRITVSYSDESTAKDVAAFIQNSLAQRSATLIGNFEMETIVSVANYVIDEELLKRQHDTINSVATLNTNLQAAENALSTLESQDTSIVKVIIKYCIFGLSLGIVIACIIMLIMFLTNGKVNTANDLLQRFPTRILTVFPPAEKSIFHAWSVKMQGYNIEPETIDQAYNLVSASIQGIRGVTITVGSCGDKLIRTVTDHINERSDIPVLFGGNVVNSAEAVLCSKDADNILLVEKLGVSKFRDVELQMEKVNEMGKNVIGIVLL